MFSAHQHTACLLSSGVTRLLNWHSAVEACTQTWMTLAHFARCSLYWSDLYTHIALQIAPYDITSCDIISWYNFDFVYWHVCLGTMIWIEASMKTWISHDILILHSCALDLWPCTRMVWPEAPGETGPTTRHLLCAPSRMNSACRPQSDFGIQQVLRPTEAWRTSSDVARQNLSMVAFRCWPPWDTSPQWLGFAEAAFKIVSAMYVFINVW